MRRAATLGLVIFAGLGGGCAEFDEWTECERCSEYRRGGYQRDERPAAAAQKATTAEPSAGVYADR
jgi:hypothetical protein